VDLGEITEAEWFGNVKVAVNAGSWGPSVKFAVAYDSVNEL